MLVMINDVESRKKIYVDILKGSIFVSEKTLDKIRKPISMGVTSGKLGSRYEWEISEDFEETDRVIDNAVLDFKQQEIVAQNMSDIKNIY